MAYVDMSMIRDAIKDDVVLDTKLCSFAMVKTCPMIILNLFLTIMILSEISFC